MSAPAIQEARMSTMSPTLPSPTASPALIGGPQSAAAACPADPPARELAPGTLMLWRHVPLYTELVPGRLGLEPPTFVFYPFQAEAHTGTIDLRQFRFAYQAAAVAFAPGSGFTSVTLAETADPNGPAYTLASAGLVDLYSVGWAARTGAVTFNP
jgi:hypothetical protein